MEGDRQQTEFFLTAPYEVCQLKQLRFDVTSESFVSLILEKMDYWRLIEIQEDS